MSNPIVLTQDHLDFLAEMTNVGSGNATSAITDLLQEEVEMEIPDIYVLTSLDNLTFLSNPDLPVVGVKMDMSGDICGDMFFLMPVKDAISMGCKAEEIMPGVEVKASEDDFSTIEEIANITAGVYLTSVREFCDLNIEYTAPVSSVDMIRALVDESIAIANINNATMLAIDNKFVGEEKTTTGTLLMIPSMDISAAVVTAYENARARLGIES